MNCFMVAHYKPKDPSVCFTLLNLLKIYSHYLFVEHANKKLCFSLDKTHWFIGNPILPNPDFPLIFDSVDGECKQTGDDTSYSNAKEVAKVMMWVQNLLEMSWEGKEISLHDIGIVTPYKKQCNRIRTDLQSRGWDAISVGSAETFQGQERRIIIVSTVRNGKQLGFLTDVQVLYQAF